MRITLSFIVAMMLGTAAYGQIDPSIINRLRPMPRPIGPNPMDMARQILEMRELQERTRLEQQMREQAERQAVIQQQQTAPAPVAPRAPEPAAPVADGRIFTLGMANGRAWGVMRQEDKIVYVMGVKDAIVTTMPPAAADFLSDFTVSEVIKSIDKLYEQPENAAMPITYAMRLSVMRFKGMAPADFDATSAAIRKVLSSPPQPLTAQ